MNRLLSEWAARVEPIVRHQPAHECFQQPTLTETVFLQPRLRYELSIIASHTAIRTMHHRWKPTLLAPAFATTHMNPLRIIAAR